MSTGVTPSGSAFSEERAVDANERVLLSGLQFGVELDGLLDAGCRVAAVVVHEAEHRVELLGLQAECHRQGFDDLRRGTIIPALDLAQVRVRHARHPREVPLRYL